MKRKTKPADGKGAGSIGRVSLPWQQPPLNEWAICGMNHYHQNGKKYLFVSMTNDGRCITEEGEDDPYLWSRLVHKACHAG